MFSLLFTGRARIALASGAALLVLAGCSSAADSNDATATVTETTIEDVLDEVATTEATADEPAVETTETTTSAEPAAASEDVTTTDDIATAEPTDDPVDDTPVEGVITDIVADATGGRSTFDGTVDEASDLEDLVVDAWGDGGLGIHRGHAQVENVLEAFLGIDHDAMHDYMDDGFNLAALSEELGKDPDALIETLTASYAPFVEEGVANGVITDAEAVEWVELLRTEFTNRVYWDGVSTS